MTTPVYRKPPPHIHADLLEDVRQRVEQEMRHNGITGEGRTPGWLEDVSRYVALAAICRVANNLKGV